MGLLFGDCEIDPECFELRRRGKLVKLEPKVFDVLLHLIEHRDRVVTKQELLDTLWPGEAVSDSVLPRCIAAMRRALGDNRNRQKTIATAHGRGYRFVAKITVESTPDAAHTGSTDPDAAARETRQVDSPARPVPAPVESEERPAQLATVASPGVASDFVGRVDRLGRLRAALDRSALGRGGISFLVGEPGIGKTRLAEEFVAIAGAVGFDHYFAHCHEGEGAPVYWPWVQILREAVGRIESDEDLRRSVGQGAADLAELVPDLAMRLGEVPSEKGPQGEQARFRLYDSATRFFVELAKQRPLLIVIDDLHWADASSLGLLRFLVGQLARVPILIVATYRDVDVRRGHPLSDMLGALARDERCDRIALSGFDQSEVGRFIEALTNHLPGEDLVRAMREMTEGNPFFLREIVHLLADEGDLDHLDSARLDSLRLPQGVRDAIGRRLDALTPECNEVLRAAAVIGRNFRLSVLVGMLESSFSGGVDELLELLAEALDANVVVEIGRGEYAFGHALTRQTLYEELRAPQRMLHHRRAGEALERNLDATRVGDESLPELAHHFYEAAAGGDVAKSIAYSVAAAEAAHRGHAYDEAVAYYERATEVATLESPLDEKRHARLLLALGEATHTAGRRADALATLDRAATLARKLEEWTLMAQAAIAIRSFGELGTRPSPGVTELLEEALERLPEDSYRLRAQLYSRLGHALAQSMDERMTLALRAIEMAERSGDSIALRDAWFSKWWATLGPDQIEGRFEVVAALDVLASRTGDVQTRLLALEAAFGAHLICGDAEAVEATLTELERVAGELRQPVFVFMAMNYRTSWLVNQGRFLEAEALVETSFEYGDGVVPFAEMACAGQRYWSRNIRGEKFDHEGRTGELVRLLDGTLIPDVMRDLFVLIMRYSNDFDAEAAYRALEKIDVRSIDRDENWLIIVSLLADVAVDVRDRPLMEWLYESMRPYERLIALHDLMRIGRGAVALPVGLLAVGLGDLDAAVGHFETAVEVEGRARMEFAKIAGEVALAGALCRRDASGDAARAKSLLAAARESIAAMPVGEENRLRRYLESGTAESPFDSDIWRPIEAS